MKLFQCKIFYCIVDPEFYVVTLSKYVPCTSPVTLIIYKVLLEHLFSVFKKWILLFDSSQIIPT